MCLLVIIPVQADVLIVNDATDGINGCPTSCTLREAVSIASSGVEIRFDTSIDTIPIVLTAGPIVVQRTITIAGNGAAKTIVDGNNQHRVFDIAASTGSDVMLIRDLTIRNGHASDGRPGGGIHNTHGLILQRVVVTDNAASDESCTPGGSGGHGGGIFNSGALIVDQSVIADNRAGNGGGCVNRGPFFDAGGAGGGIYNLGDPGNSLILFRSSVTGNRSGNGADASPVECGSGQSCASIGGLSGNGGGIFSSGLAYIDLSTIADNRVGDGGAGGDVNCAADALACNSRGGDTGLGGGISSINDLTIVNSTISGNRGGTPGAGGLCIGAGPCGSGSGGDGSGGGIHNSNGLLTLDSVTITLNEVFGNAVGGGVVVASPNFVRNTIIAGNAGASPDCAAFQPLNSLGHNLIGDTSPSCGITGDTTGNILNVPAELGVLADNGGPTRTHRPLDTSPALDAGSCNNGALAIDQRGLARPVDIVPPMVNDNCDIGAVEQQVPDVFCTVPPVNAIPDNDPAGLTSILPVVRGAMVLADVDVLIRATHTWVGDLTFTVEHVDTGESTTIIERPGLPAIGAFGCAEDNIFTLLDDGALLPVEDQCDAGGFAIAGVFTPNGPLAVFQGESLAGTWQLTVTDSAAGDLGTLDEWCLLARQTFLANQAPILAPIGTRFTSELDTLVIPLLATDPDGNGVSFTAAGLPPLCTLSDNGNGTGQITCMPSLGDSGEYPVSVAVTDDSVAMGQTTENFILAVYPFGQKLTCSSPAQAIPDNDPIGIFNAIFVEQDGVLEDLTVSIQASHTWIGDLTFILRNEATGTTATLIDRPGTVDPMVDAGCPEDDIDTQLDDGAALPVEDQCAPNPPAIGGVFTPNEPLSIYNDEIAGASWVLTVSDNAGADTGTLDTWCLLTTVVTDSDGDGVLDIQDNCLLVDNPDQTDSNLDGFGNECDADIAGPPPGIGDDDCLVNFLDLTAMSEAFFSNPSSPNWNPDADLGGSQGFPDNLINFVDLTIMSDQFFGTPGPSGIAECSVR